MKHSYEKLYWSLVSAPASVQFSGLIVGSLASAPFTRAVYQSDGWILGLSNCHPCSDRSRVRFCVFITSLRTCHLCCRVSLNCKPTPSWQFDISPQALRSSFCFNLLVLRLVRLRIVPFSVPCCPSYFCFGLRCAWLNRFWFHLLLFADTFCGSVFPRLSLLFFSPTTSWCFNMTLQVFAVMLCWMVLTLACPETVPFALPCCLSCICFGARCAWSNRLCVEFRVVSCFPLPTSFANLYGFWYPQKMTWGGWVSPFCRAKSDFWGPRPLQNEEPATNLGVFSTKSGCPTPFFWCTFVIFTTTGLYKMGSLAWANI